MNKPLNPFCPVMFPQSHNMGNWSGSLHHALTLTFHCLMYLTCLPAFLLKELNLRCIHFCRPFMTPPIESNQHFLDHKRYFSHIFLERCLQSLLIFCYCSTCAHYDCIVIPCLTYRGHLKSLMEVLWWQNFFLAQGLGDFFLGVCAPICVLVLWWTRIVFFFLMTLGQCFIHLYFSPCLNVKCSYHHLLDWCMLSFAHAQSACTGLRRYKISVMYEQSVRTMMLMK